MSEQSYLKSLSTRNTGRKGSAWTRSYTSASISATSEPQSVRSGTCPQLSRRHCGDRVIADESATGVSLKEPQSRYSQQRQAARKALRSSVHTETGGLRHSCFLSSPGHKAYARREQEIHIQFPELGQTQAEQWLCKRERSDNQQVGQQHQKFSNLSGADTKSVSVDEEVP